jgi:hypothetical protein
MENSNYITLTPKVFCCYVNALLLFTVRNHAKAQIKTNLRISSSIDGKIQYKYSKSFSHALEYCI